MKQSNKNLDEGEEEFSLNSDDDSGEQEGKNVRGDMSDNSSPLRSESQNGDPTPLKDQDEEQEDPANKDFKKRFKADLFAGHIPTKVDDQQKAQMMGFIAYAQNLNETVKL